MKILLTSAAVLLATSGVTLAATDIDIALWDANKDGYVDVAEYNAGMKAQNVTVIPMSLDEIQEWIKVNNPELVVTATDKNKDGELQKSEVTVQGDASVVKAGDAVVVEDQVGPDFLAFDLDHDGRLDQSEFNNWQAFATKIGIFLNK